MEIWGGVGSNKFQGTYDITHEIKLNIYNKLNYNLISFYPNDFNKSYEDIQKMFYDKFKSYIDLKYKKIDNSKISSYKYKADEDVLDEVMKYLKDDYYLPRESEISKLNSTLYVEVYKRFGNFSKMAEQYNMIDRLQTKPIDYWNKNTIFDSLNKVFIKYGYIMSKTDLYNNSKCPLCVAARAAICKITSYGGKVYFDLLVLDNHIDDISERDYIYLNKIINGSVRHNEITNIEYAQQILTKYNKSA